MNQTTTEPQTDAPPRQDYPTQTVDTAEGLIEIHTDYTPTRRGVHDKQGVVHAFARKDWPTHRTESAGESYRTTIRNTPKPGTNGGRKTQHAVLWPDGHGTCYHYRTLCGIHTRNGLTINNQQNWTRGQVALYIIPMSMRNYNLPLTALSEMTRGTDVNLHDITSVRTGENAELVFFNHGELVVGIGYDKTTAQGDGQFMFTLTEDERNAISDEPDNIYRLLLPAGFGRELDAGYHLNENPRFEGIHAKPETIMRQGEHFFVPRPDLGDYRLLDTEVGEHADENGLEKPQSHKRRYGGGYKAHHDLGSHAARDYLRLLDGRRFVRGTIRHIRNEHRMINLGEVWHEVFTNTREVQVVTERSTRSD